MLKKISALSLAALMALSVLSGCGGQNSSSASAAAGDSASAAETGSGEEVTITYISSTILESRKAISSRHASMNSMRWTMAST